MLNLRRSEFSLTLGVALLFGLSLVPVSQLVLVRVANRTNLLATTTLIVAFLVVLPIWISLLLKKNLLGALIIETILLNVTGRAGEIAGIVAFEDADGYQQVISVTTFMILFALFFAFPKATRESRQRNRIVESLLLCFAAVTTVSQFINHRPAEAFWLSIGGAWQYVALYYLFVAAVLDVASVRRLLAAIVVTMACAVIVRMALYNQGLFVPAWMTDGAYITAADGYARVVSVSFGSIYYAGYLAVTLFIALYIVRTAKGKPAALMAGAGLVVIAAELVSTFTRGAWLTVGFIALLPLWKRERKVSALVAAAIAIACVVFSARVLSLLQERELYIDSRVMDLPSVADRFELWRLSAPHVFDNFGFGHGMGKYLTFQTSISSGQYESSHNLLLDLSQGAGAIAAGIFVAMFIVVVSRVWRRTRFDDEAGCVSRYLLLALSGWFFFANTTALSVLYYVPYESTCIFYLLLFSADAVAGYPSDGVVALRTMDKERPLWRRSTLAASRATAHA
jgi:hypothetical protein